MNILVIRFSSLGDIILTTSFLNSIKTLYPKSNIYYATKKQFSDIIKNQPYIDKVVELEENESVLHFSKKFNVRFDWTFDLHNNIRSRLLSLLINSKRTFRIKKHTLYRYQLIHKKSFAVHFANKRKSKDNIEDMINLIPNIKNIKHLEEIKPILKIKKKELNIPKTVIGVAPGAKWATKMWPKEYFKELINMVNQNLTAEFALFGSKDEVPIAKYIKSGYKNVMDFTGKLSVRETASIMQNCSVIISNDSALMHMADALDIPILAIFGPTVKEFGFYPRGKSIILEKNLPCRPCSPHGGNRCPIQTHICMKSIKPEEVLKSIKILLEVKENQYEQ